MSDHDGQQDERFAATGGRVTSLLALLSGAGVAVIGLLDPSLALRAELVTGGLLFAALAWATGLWPAVRVTDAHLVLRNTLETVVIPLAAVEEVAVRQVLAVRVGERRHVSPAIGKPWRKLATGGASADAADGRPVEQSYPDFVEERIRRLAEDARDAAGIRRWSDEQEALAAQVRRTPAWPVIAPLAVLAVAFVAALVT